MHAPIGQASHPAPTLTWMEPIPTRFDFCKMETNTTPFDQKYKPTRRRDMDKLTGIVIHALVTCRLQYWKDWNSKVHGATFQDNQMKLQQQLHKETMQFIETHQR